MYKKLIIVASVLLVAGGVTLARALDQRRIDREEIADYQSRYSAQTVDLVRQYNEWLQMPPQERTAMPLFLDKDGKAKTREQLRQEEQGRFKADMDKLANGAATNPSLADILYGENWQQELKIYKERQQFNRLVLTSSIVSASAGGLVYVVWLLWIAARLIVKAAKGSKALICRAGRAIKERGANETQAGDASDEDAVDEEPEAETDEPESKSEPRPKIPVAPVTPATVDRPRRTMGSLTQRPATSREKERASLLLTDDKSSVAVKTPPANEPVRLDLSESAKPIDNTLNDLTQQVSAIREYAANQQGRLEKLQDGYDWNIIRTFCLRVIRCIDNIENRIAKLANKKAQRTLLEEVRDELIFALESSGIEQFEPEIETEYRGKEKLAEAVKDKVSCDDPEQAGRIAEVVRPGYQYLIDEGNTKIVRPAQVKLYA
ncbi:MAG: nucleotide exchange factor GrpE [Planctomycetota bacterium]|jgi:molecular chaperone GrpE (heat shock protein)